MFHAYVSERIPINFGDGSPVSHHQWEEARKTKQEEHGENSKETNHYHNHNHHLQHLHALHRLYHHDSDDNNNKNKNNKNNNKNKKNNNNNKNKNKNEKNKNKKNKKNKSRFPPNQITALPISTLPAWHVFLLGTWDLSAAEIVWSVWSLKTYGELPETNGAYLHIVTYCN